MFISVAWSRWLKGSVSMSSLQFHFLQTLEHRTDVSVTSTSRSGRLQRSRECPGHWLDPCGVWSVLGPPPEFPHWSPASCSPGVSPAQRLAHASGASHKKGFLTPLGPSSLPSAALLPLPLPACSSPVGVRNLDLWLKPLLSCTLAHLPGAKKGVWGVV